MHGTVHGTPLIRDAHAARHGPGDRGTQVKTVHRITIFVEYQKMRTGFSRMVVTLEGIGLYLRKAIFEEMHELLVIYE
jgi:hypothetical protein